MRDRPILEELDCLLEPGLLRLVPLGDRDLFMRYGRDRSRLIMHELSTERTGHRARAELGLRYSDRSALPFPCAQWPVYYT